MALPETTLDIPSQVLDRLEHVLKDVPEARCIERVSEDTVTARFFVADHPDPDCEYVSQLVLVWDLPGQVTGHASIGIWNPPTPADGHFQSPLLDLTEADQTTLHAIVKRALAIPAAVADTAYSRLNQTTNALVPQLIEHGIPVSSGHFKPGAGLMVDKYHGLIRAADDSLHQWREMIRDTASD